MGGKVYGVCYESVLLLQRLACVRQPADVGVDPRIRSSMWRRCGCLRAKLDVGADVVKLDVGYGSLPKGSRIGPADS